jgi:TonB family protein
LDRTPNVLKRGVLTYPPHLKRRGLEGEVKLLVQINEKGRVKVLEVVSSTHPDFNESSKKAAEGSTYEAPKRNGEAVQVQFYLPIRYSLLNQ